MSKSTTYIILIAIAMGIIGFIVSQITTPISYKDICTNNDTRDYAYEAYCDSIWNNDKNYYLDVLTETDEYQLYLESHGSWWYNNN